MTEHGLCWALVDASDIAATRMVPHCTTSAARSRSAERRYRPARLWAQANVAPLDTLLDTASLDERRYRARLPR